MKKLLIYYLLIAVGLFARGNLAPGSFSLIVEETYEKYEAEGFQTNWHEELYQNYLTALGPACAHPISAYELEKRGMKQEFIDQMIIEYVKKRPNTFIVLLFPPLVKEPPKAFAWLSKYGEIVYHKTIKLPERGIRNLLRGVYDVHHCDGWQSTYQGIYTRFQHLLSPKKVHEICVVIWEGPSLELAIECKRKIRQDCGGDHRVVHFSDRHHETVHNAEFIFNENSICYLKTVSPKDFDSFISHARQIRTFLKTHLEFHDAYCVDTGAVLSAFGLRACSDFDLIIDHRAQNPFPNWGLNNFTREKYGSIIDDLIYNPREHFYHKGIRFVSLERVLDFKLKKNSGKDQGDVQLIRAFLNQDEK